jgi:hypothetical protein
MEGRLNTCRSILAAVAFAALATTAGSAQHGGSKSAPKSDGGANHEGHAPGGAGKTGAGKSDAGKSGGAAHGIDLVRPDDGYASLRRRATRSSLIADSLKKNPAIVPPRNTVVHPPAPLPGAPAEHARNAIGVTAPTNTGLGNAGIAHPVPGVAVGNVATTSTGGGEIHHAIPHPVPIAVAPSHSTGLSGTAMGRPTTSPATLGGPAHTVSGIGGANVRLKH